MPVNREHTISPWPDGITVEEIRKIQLERQEREPSNKQRAEQKGCILSPSCSANYHTIGCPGLKNQ